MEKTICFECSREVDPNDVNVSTTKDNSHQIYICPGCVRWAISGLLMQDAIRKAAKRK